MKLITRAEKERRSMDALILGAKMSREFYKKPLVICYSGGKDSDVLLHLALRCLDPADIYVLNSHTTVDAPETVYHIREVFAELKEKGIQTEIRMPTYKGKPTTMWKLIAEQGMPPTRQQRYCCSVLKESSTKNCMTITGVRADESAKRRGRDIFSIRGKTYKDGTYYTLDHAEEVFEEAKDNEPVWDCKLIETARKNKEIYVSPIYEWTEVDIWEYIRDNDIKTNPLYAQGYLRVGCVACPLGGWKTMERDFSRYPTYKRAYIRAFKKMLDKKREKGKPAPFVDEYAVFRWWINAPKQVEGQMTIEDWMPSAVPWHEQEIDMALYMNKPEEK